MDNREEPFNVFLTVFPWLPFSPPSPNTRGDFHKRAESSSADGTSGTSATTNPPTEPPSSPSPAPSESTPRVEPSPLIPPPSSSQPSHVESSFTAPITHTSTYESSTSTHSTSVSAFPQLSTAYTDPTTPQTTPTPSTPLPEALQPSTTPTGPSSPGAHYTTMTTVVSGTPTTITSQIPTALSTSTTSAPYDIGKRTAIIAGATIAGFLILLILAVVFLYRRRRLKLKLGIPERFLNPMRQRREARGLLDGEFDEDGDDALAMRAYRDFNARSTSPNSVNGKPQPPFEDSRTFVGGFVDPFDPDIRKLNVDRHHLTSKDGNFSGDGLDLGGTVAETDTVYTGFQGGTATSSHRDRSRPLGNSIGHSGYVRLKEDPYFRRLDEAGSRS